MTRSIKPATFVALIAVTPVAQAQTSTYGFDALGRVTRVTETGGPSPSDTSYMYDLAGNRTLVIVTPEAAARSSTGSGEGRSATAGIDQNRVGSVDAK